MTFTVNIKEYINISASDYQERIVDALSFTDKHEFAERIRTNTLAVKLGNLGAFEGSRVIDVGHQDMSGVDLSNAAIYWHIRFEGTDLSGANLSGADLSGGELRYCNLTGADLRNSRFFDASLRYAKLTDAKLGGASFSNACLGGADCRNVDFRGAKLRSTAFNSSFYSEESADLRGALLTGTDATFARFRDANCAGADFQRTNLTKTSFRGANLNGANLSDTMLSGACFWSAKMEGTDFSRSRGTLSADFRFASVDKTVWKNRFGFERSVHKLILPSFHSGLYPA